MSHVLCYHLPSLTFYSAEVNIGIVAACLPTLLPLYRLLRDKIDAARARSGSKTGRFPQCVFGQGGRTDTSQTALWERRKAATTPIPQNAQWASSPPHAIIRVGKVEDGDLEMQTRFME